MKNENKKGIKVRKEIKEKVKKTKEQNFKFKIIYRII